MASPDDLDSNNLFVWLIGLLEFFVEERELGEVFGSRAAFRLDALNSPEPDIAFVRKSRLGQIAGGHFHGAPDLAVELVSPDSVEDKRTGVYYFVARIEIEETRTELAKRVTLHPGQRTEILLLTGERTLLDHVLDPLLRNINRAFRA